MVGQIEPAFLDGNVGNVFLAPRPFEFFILRDDLGLVTTIIVVGKLEENNAQHWRRICAWFKARVCAEVIGSTPKISF